MPVNRCTQTGTSLILGCDANSQPTVWGSININQRVTALLEYLTTDMDIPNLGNTLTFRNAKSVLDLTLCSTRIVHNIQNCRVIDEPSSTHHELNSFEVGTAKLDKMRQRIRYLLEGLERREAISAYTTYAKARYEYRTAIIKPKIKLWPPFAAK